MKNKNVTDIFGKIWEFIKKNKFVMVVLLAGLVLILLPTGSKSQSKDTGTVGTPAAAEFSLSAQEDRISEALSRIEGAGKVTVVLTLRCGTEQVLAQDEIVSNRTNENGDSAEMSSERSVNHVVISAGSSTETPITLKYIYPEYLGALVVAEGADNPAVKLQLTRAVSGLTGLGADRIVVTKMNKA